MKYIVNYSKGEEMKYISHLDIQRLVQRAFRRANLPLAYSQGFNPHPLLSFASALAVGYTGEAEWLEMRLTEERDEKEMVDAINKALPIGFSVSEIKRAPDEMKTLTSMTHSARYKVALEFEDMPPIDKLQSDMQTFLDAPIIVNKRTKAGMRDVDLRPKLIRATLRDDGKMLFLHGIHNSDGGLNVELFMQALLLAWDTKAHYKIHRSELYFTGSSLLPRCADEK